MNLGPRIGVAVISGLLLFGIRYYEQKEGQGELPAEYTQGPEARQWLQNNKSDSALASNRFGETRNALEFVKQLYQAGATKVIVPLGMIQADEVESYADGLVVTLPTDPDKRQRVWKLCVEELRREGDRPPATAPADNVLLWWD